MAVVNNEKRLEVDKETLFIVDGSERLRLFESDKAAMMFLSFLEMDFLSFKNRVQSISEKSVIELIDFNYLIKFLYKNGNSYWLEKLLSWIRKGDIVLSKESLDTLKSLLVNKSYPQKIRHLAKKVIASKC